MTKALNYISYFTLILAAVFMALAGYWLLYPYQPINIKSMEVLSSEVAAGRTLVYQVDYCKSAPIKANITRSFVNGVIFTTNTVAGDVPAGCHVNKVYIPVPQELTSGSYSLRVTWVYRVNPIREISITKDSNKFNIIGSDIDRQADQKSE